MNIQIVEDCGDKGSDNFKRPAYESGQVKTVISGYGLHGDFLSILGDPDYKTCTSPSKGRDLKMVRKLDPITNNPDTNINARPDPRPVQEGFSQTAKEILLQCEDFSTWWPPHDNEAKAKVQEHITKLDDEWAKLEAAQSGGETGGESGEAAKDAAKTPDTATPGVSATNVSPPEGGGDDGASQEDEAPGGAAASKKSLPLAPGKSLVGGVRKCLDKGVKDANHEECQLCENEMECDQKK